MKIKIGSVKDLAELDTFLGPHAELHFRIEGHLDKRDYEWWFVLDEIKRVI